MRQQFGAKSTKKDLELYAKSKHWDGQKFQNLEETNMQFNIQALPKMLYKQFCDKEGRAPAEKIPISKIDTSIFLENSDHLKFIWYGHGVFLFRLNGKTILIDPMFGPDAAPIAPFGVKRFSENTYELIDDLPEIDLVMLTHDHYDHLDLTSILKLKPKVKHYFVAMGVERHLRKWGIEENQITPFDWWERANYHGIEITFTPSRHFSGRGISDRFMGLWGGWVFKTNNENLWYSGDGGYGTHFKEIGERFGPFDFAWLECGQYNENWHEIHMYPEESVQAALDSGSKKIMPFHWAGFPLAQHKWTDPVERFIAACENTDLTYIIPKLGELIMPNAPYLNERWWEQYG
ncbi:MAG: MBL fold metallo-hydrolase [Saprospiraceae bacterium]|nr:MBL fold metallo-hydrolase [Saprospiraceae bacterium]